MKSIDPAKHRGLHRAVLSWYSKHQRELQWRTTANPYEILVSEIMLQQTQVSRVKEKLPLFLQRFPTFRALSNASTADVIRAWEGMGYNNRAVRLTKLAKIITRKYNNRLPSCISELQSLPGIGPYTAHAVACFSFHQHVPVIDVNIRRVLSRLFTKAKSVSDVVAEEEIWNVAQRVLPHNAYFWNQALMDIGATVCSARQPMCTQCPVQRYCKSRFLGSSVQNSSIKMRTEAREPSHRGLPRRIWRGKIIQTLRELPDRRSISLISLHRTIQLRNTDMGWFVNLVHQLEKDGLVSTAKRSSRIFVSLTA